VLGAPNGFATLTTRLYADLQLASTPASFDDAVTLALLLVAIAAVLLVPLDVVLGPRLRSRRSASLTQAAPPHRSRTAVLAGVVVLLLYAALGYGLPTVALIAAALTRAVGLSPTPGNWTLGNFRVALDGSTRAAMWHSLQLAALAAVLLVLLGSAVAALERYRTGRTLASLGTLTLAVPGSALAVGLLIAYQHELGGTLALILVAYLAKFWALAHRTISAAVDRLSPGEWQAARLSGAGPVAVLRTVWVPALAPALLGAGVLVFVTSLHEVTMSSLLYSTGNETVAVAVLNDQELGSTGVTAALSVTLTALVLGVALAGWALVRASQRVGARPALRVAGV
jgi:iron(III) transport system permease protein